MINGGADPPPGPERFEGPKSDGPQDGAPEQTLLSFKSTVSDFY